MPSLEQRVSELEHKQASGNTEPCFWCECEQADGEPPVRCTHRNWNPIPHEAALAELT